MHQRRAIQTWLISALIVGSCLAGLAMLAHRDYQQLSSDTEISAQPVNPAAANGSTGYSLQSIRASQLFGAPPDPKPVVQERPKVLPETRLNLKLMGTFTSTLSNAASALITDGGGRSKRYFVGQQVPGNAELVAVYKDSVTLRRNGRDEALKFPRLSGEAGLSPATNSPAANPRLAHTAPARSTPQPAIEPEPVMPEDDGLDQSAPSAGNSANNSRSSLKDRLNRLRSRNKR